MSIKLKQLGHILALEEHGSFSRAAVALRISQPALSRSIQGLETQIGAQLFLREGHGVVPTDLGRVLIERARQITRLADDLHDQLLGSPAVARRELAIGAGPFPAETLIGRAVAGFIGAHPQFRLRIETRNWDELLPRLRNHELDLFVAEISTLEHETDLEVEPLSRHPIYVVARAGHPLAGSAGVGLGEILKWPLAAMARIPPRLLEPALVAIPRPPANARDANGFPALACSDFSLVKQVVSASDVVLATSLPCVARELECKEMVVLGAEPWMQLNYGIVALRSRPQLNMAATGFRAFLAEAERAVLAEEAELIARFVPVARSGRRGTAAGQAAAG
jgi:DNA-binding transcriptional LysR family regulator